MYFRFQFGLAANGLPQPPQETFCNATVRIEGRQNSQTCRLTTEYAMNCNEAYSKFADRVLPEAVSRES